MPELTRERRLEILRNLGDTKCGSCGGVKSAKMSHCRSCYFALPPFMRNALYKGFGEGYEEAYEESLKYLAGVCNVKSHAQDDAVPTKKRKRA